MSKKIHFNAFDLQTVDKATLPHMVYNLDGIEYYVKTKKAETSDKVNGKGILKFGNYEWLIKNIWTIVLPVDCTNYMSKTYNNIYSKFTQVPDDYDSSNVTNMNSMFSDCSELLTIPILNTSKTTNMNNMFNSCNALKNIDWIIDMSACTTCDYMFNGCNNISLATFKNVNYTAIGCTDTIGFAKKIGLDSSKIKVYRKLTTTNKTMKTLYPNTYTTMISVPSTDILDTSGLKNLSNLFQGCPKLTTTPTIDTSSATNMSAAFADSPLLTSISSIDTSNVVDASYMFSECTTLATVPELKTNKMIDMSNMFGACKKLPAKFPWAIDCSSVTTADAVSEMFIDSSVKEVTFKNVKESIKVDFNADCLGTQVTKINFI